MGNRWNDSPLAISPGIIDVTQTRSRLNDATGEARRSSKRRLFLASDEASFVIGIDVKVGGAIAIW